MIDSRSARWASRVLATATVLAFATVGLLAFAPANVAAAAVPPYFGPNVRVDALPAYTAYVPSMAAGTDGVVYVVFSGWAGTPTWTDIFFTKSADGGRTWTAPIRVNNDAGGASQTDPSLALGPDDDVYVAWADSRAGGTDIYFALSSDGGLSFSSNVRVNDVTSNWQNEPEVAVDSAGLVHVIWTDNRNAATTGPDIYYANSTDGGLSFNPSVRINNDATGAEQSRPDIAAGPDRTVYATWSDPRNSGRGRDIYFSTSSDLGETWTPNIVVNDDTGLVTQDYPSLAVSPAGNLFLVWMDYRTTNTAPDIYTARSTNRGASFSANVIVNDDRGVAWQGTPNVAANANGVRAVWGDTRTWGSTGYDIYSAGSSDGLTWSSSVKVNDDTLPTNQQQAPVVALDAVGNAYAAWYDQRDSGSDVYLAALDVVAPTANAGAAQSAGQGTTMSFNASASFDNMGIARYEWDFGDDVVADGPVVGHAYRNPGTYQARLTVWDYSGNSDSHFVTATVLDTEAPVALGGGARVVDEGQPLQFDASASTDNVGIVSFAWDFGDNETASEAAVTHVYDVPGTYTATLTVRDAAGNIGTAAMRVTVRVVSPKTSALLETIQMLEALVAALFVALGIVGYLAFTAWWRTNRRPDDRTPLAAEMRAKEPAKAPPTPAQPAESKPAEPKRPGPDEPDILEMEPPFLPP